MFTFTILHSILVCVYSAHREAVSAARKTKQIQQQQKRKQEISFETVCNGVRSVNCECISLRAIRMTSLNMNHREEHSDSVSSGGGKNSRKCLFTK